MVELERRGEAEIAGQLTHIYGVVSMGEFRGVVDILQDQEVKPPSFLYKYYSFTKFTSGIFQNNELYFESPNNFNDPFDCHIIFQIEGSKQQRKRLFRTMQPRVNPNIPRHKALHFEKRFKDQHWDIGMMEGMKRDFLERRGRIGVYCMTQKKDDILMWSHYAGVHTGFCLEFHTDDAFFSQVHPVTYANKRPCVNVLMPCLEQVPSVYAEGLLTKAAEWAYECEWRIIHISNGKGVHQFPPKVLHGVILGCRIDPEDKVRVVEWCSARQPRPVLYQAKQKEAEFGLDIEEIGY